MLSPMILRDCQVSRTVDDERMTSISCTRRGNYPATLSCHLARMSVESLPHFASGTIWRFRWPSIFAAGAALIICGWLFRDGLSAMWDRWAAPEFSHSLLIPPLAAFLVWQQKDRL